MVRLNNTSAHFSLVFFVLFFCGLLYSNTLQAQDDFPNYTNNTAPRIAVRSLAFLGIATNERGEYFYNGGGLELTYQHPLGKGGLTGGLEYRMINWGNQVALNIGYDIPYWQSGSWKLSGLTSLQAGLALFQQRPLFVWGAEYVPQLQWQSKRRFFANLGIGIRMTNNPAYSNYGSINFTVDVPIKIGIGFRLGQAAAE